MLSLYQVSQFTLLASTKKGNKPDFHKSAGGDKAKELYDQFFKSVQAQYQPDRVKDGVFQAMMDVSLTNDGPVSFLGSEQIMISSAELSNVVRSIHLGHIRGRC